MKINPGQMVDLQTAPLDRLSSVLLFGPDQGLILETATRFITAVAGKPVNPFLLVELTSAQLKADPARLYDEIHALPMLGERKIIVVKQATDAIASVFEAALDTSSYSNFLLVEAGALSPRSKLRKTFEAAKSAGAAGCYGDNHYNLDAIVREVMEARHVQISSDAIIELTARLGSDRMVSRNEIEKLALYAGEGGQIDIDDIVRVVGDNAAISLEEIVFATTDGDSKLADQSLTRALADGISPIQVLRAFQIHLQRLHAVVGELQNGEPLNLAVGKLKPPVFFKVKTQFQQQCRRWSLNSLSAAMCMILDTERQCKKTGAPMTAICHRTVLRLAAVARKQRHHDY